MIFGCAARPKAGETVSGDAILVRDGPGRSLFAVIDALGHGPAAHAAAERALAALRTMDLSLSATELMTRLHLELRGSRGAAITLGLLHGRQLELVGIGNVELRSRYGYVPFAPTPGIVGITIRKPRAIKCEVPLTIRLFLFTDGLSRRLDVEAVDHLGAEPACQALLERHGNQHDDASILCLEPRAR